MKNFSREIMNDDIRNKKIGTLLFIIHYEFLNDIWNFIIRKKYKIVPADLSIYRIGENLQAHNSSWLMLNSKDFPATGFDGKKVKKGIIKIGHKKKEIRFKGENYK